jgi:hypothetical protein
MTSVDVAVAHDCQVVVAAHIHHQGIVLDIVVILDSVQPSFSISSLVYIVHPGIPSGCWLFHPGWFHWMKAPWAMRCFDYLHEVILYQ